MQGDLQTLKQLLQARHAAIADAHLGGAPGTATCGALTTAMDEVLGEIHGMIAGDREKEIAVLALGGYGRRELCPHSDVDVMVLCSVGSTRDAAGEIAKEFLHLLWDAGITVGHSVRTIDEALQTRGSSVDSWASVLESRFVCGDQALAADLYSTMHKVIKPGEDRWFMEGVFEDIRNRHVRYGNSVKLLEPNIKKSAGGLRDVHTALWLYRSNDPDYFFTPEDSSSLTSGFLRMLMSRGVIDKDEHHAASTAYDFLLRTRHSMHYRRNALHDMLEYALQLDVAEDLGYGPKSELRSVEVFMREYYLHARVIHRLHQRLANLVRETFESGAGHAKEGERVGELFVLHGEVLSLADGILDFEDARLMFEAFLHVADRDVELDFRLRSAIEKSADLITAEVCSDESIAAIFRRILGSRRVAKTLGEMNDLGILGRYIPEFGDLVAFFQHNVYHYFTADEHTLVAVANAERLRDQQGILREVFRNLKRKDLLYMTILLHDIGKPKGVGDHEVTGVGMARTILARLGLQEIFEDVAFLIRNHLVMEQIAFRRNIHDPETIKELAGKFERPELLDYLYLLTYADLSAVNVNVWTEWKASMLQDLYMRTAEVLRRNLKGSQIDAYHQSKQEAAEAGVVERLSTAFPREEIEHHLRGIQSEGYTAVFSEGEIARHMEAGRIGKTVTTRFAHSEGFTEITIIARDAPFTLSRFCAVLSANDANIFDANVFTHDDGVVFDRFRVSGAVSKRELDERVCSKIADDLTRVIDGTIDVARLFEAHHRRWKRRPRLPVNPNTRIDVEFEDNPRYTIVDVYAPDTVGFLYRITETISRLGLDIYFAKIATRVDGIVDAFYVLDRDRNPVSDPQRREEVRSEILASIKNLQGQELA